MECIRRIFLFSALLTYMAVRMLPAGEASQAYGQELELLRDPKTQEQVLAWGAHVYAHENPFEKNAKPRAELPQELKRLCEPEAIPVLAKAATDADLGFQRAALLLLDRVPSVEHPRSPHDPVWDAIPFSKRCDFYVWLLRFDSEIVFYGPRCPGPLPPPSSARLIEMGPEVIPAVARALEKENTDAQYAARLARVIGELCSAAPLLAWPAIEKAERMALKFEQPSFGHWVVPDSATADRPWPRMRLLLGSEYLFENDGEFNRRALSVFLQRLTNPGYLRETAITRLATIQDYCPSDLIERLALTTETPPLAARWAIAHGYSDIVPALLASNNRNPDVATAIRVLARPQHATVLMDRLKRSDHLAVTEAEILTRQRAPGIEDELLKRLGRVTDHPYEYPALCRSLGDLKSVSAVPEFIKLLTHKNENVRHEAARGLLRIGTRDAIEAVLTAYPNYDSWPKSEPFLPGRHARAEACDVLLADAAKGRSYALSGLGELRDPKAIPQLLTHAKDESRFVRVGVLRALAGLHPPEAAGVLIEALRDEEWSVSTGAEVALALLHEERAVPGILERIASKKGNVSNLAYLLGTERAIEVLKQAFVNEPDEKRRVELAVALAWLGDATGAEVLARNYRQHHNAIELLGRLGRSDLLPNETKDAIRTGLLKLSQPYAERQDWAIKSASLYQMKETVPDLVNAAAHGAPGAWHVASRLDPGGARDAAIDRIVKGEGLPLAGQLTGPLSDQQKERLIATARAGRFLPIIALANANVLESSTVLREIAEKGDLVSRFAALLALASTQSNKDWDTAIWLERNLENTEGAFRWATAYAMSHSVRRSERLCHILMSMDARDQALKADSFTWLVQAMERKDIEHGMLPMLSPVALFDPSPFRRIEALRGIYMAAKAGDKDARELLLRLARQDSDSLVRCEAAASLLSIPGEQAEWATALRKYLSEGHTDVQVRAAELMAESGHLDFLPDLLRVADASLDDDSLIPEPYQQADLRHRLTASVLIAIEKLGKYSAEKVENLEPLLLGDCGRDRLIALIALARTGNRRFEPILRITQALRWVRHSPTDGQIEDELFRWAFAMIDADRDAYSQWLNTMSQPSNRWARILWGEYLNLARRRLAPGE